MGLICELLALSYKQIFFLVWTLCGQLSVLLAGSLPCPDPPV